VTGKKPVSKIGARNTDPPSLASGVSRGGNCYA
jgi:hypothetical protein